MPKEENKTQEFKIKSLVPELLYILVLFIAIGIGFIVLIFLDEKYQYLAKFGAKLGKLILKF